ncbi:hypothetical protein G9A89_009261 [Geosiphon pyriformis]|nr:hypothetical protein G9A89_009261 [Geosiphon pyriformis]
MLENNRRTAADNIKRHDKHLSEQPMEFKIENQVLLHRTKAEKQILKKVVHGNRLKIYHEKQELSSSVPQIRTQISLIRPEDISRNLEPIIIIKTTKIRAEKRRTRVQLELNVPSPTHHSKGNMGGKIAFRWKTPDNTQKWKERLPPAYWFYKIEEQLDLKTLYKDLSQKTFNKEAIQQVEKFVGKNNLTLHYKAVYQLYVIFQHCPNVLLNGSMKTIMVNNIGQITNQQFKDLQKAILKATIKHYTNEATITDTYGFTGAQF